MMKNRLIWLVVAAVGCGGPTWEDDDEEPALILTNPNDSDGISPYIVSGEMICNPGSTSPDTLNIVVSANDPQGVDTIDSDGGMTALDSSGEVLFEDLLMPCNSSGQCTAGFTVNEYSGLDCSSAWDYTFTARVWDEEGNVSEPGEITYTGR